MKFVERLQALKADKNKTFLLLTVILQTVALFLVVAPLALLSDFRYLFSYAVSLLVGSGVEFFGTRAEIWSFYNNKKPSELMCLNWGALGTIIVFAADKITP